MNKIEIEEKNNKKTKRILALIFSGIYVAIVLPIIGVLVSLYLDSVFGFPAIIISPINIVIGVIVLANGFFWTI